MKKNNIYKETNMNKIPVQTPQLTPTTSSRISIYDPRLDRMVRVSPHSAKAKALYRYYIQELDYDPAWIVPKDLKYYPSSGRFFKVKPPKPAFVTRTAYKSYLASFTLNNHKRLQGFKGFDLLQQFTPVLSELIAKHGGIKFHASARCMMDKTLEGQVLQELDDFFITSSMRSVTNSSQLADALSASIDTMREQVPEKETQGSGWVFKRVILLEMHVAKYKPLKGSSYFDLPRNLKLKKAIVNVKNKDDHCFQWSVLAALFPSEHHGERVSHYTKHVDKLDWSGLTFPVALSDIPKFEQRNCISINVYGYDKGPYVLHKSHLDDATTQHVDLLYIQQAGQSHYCWIKDFSRFARVPSDHKHCAKHFCRHCLHGFPTHEKLQIHLTHGCREITEARPVMPSGDDAVLAFKNFDKQYKAPFVIYADFECLTKPISKASRDSSRSHTDAYQRHEPCGFCAHIVSSDPNQTFKPVVYRGDNTVQEFIIKIKEIEDMLMAKIRTTAKMVMSDAEKQQHRCASHCCLCKKPLDQDKVRDHCHLTGRYRGAAHSSCNLEEGKKRTRRYKIPVFFHNLKGYDGHLIVSEVGKHTSNLSAIPQNYEKFISFSFSHLRFLDSMGFLNASLDTLGKNLYENGKGKDKFIHSARHCAKPEHLDLVLKKGVYPYDYMSDWSRFEEQQLPAQSKFYSKLSDTDISKDDYLHAQQVWSTFGCKTLGDYHDLYMKTDVLLLADVFENFRSICLEYYELDPAHYFTTPNFAWDAMLKVTGVQLELLQDYDMHLMVEQGLRGGIAMISHRHAEANNPYMGDEYDKNEEHSYIAYLDANNLYGQAMVQSLPSGGFEWSDERGVDALIERYADNETQGCIVKCDIEYPAALHDDHNDYPLAPERKLVTAEMLSPYATALQSKLQIGKDVAEKLVPNLMNKRGYVVDIRNLKYYVEKGLRVTNIHSVITFNQSKWMKSYIDFNTEKRKQAKNDFEKDFFKLMYNSCFGKTMENLRNRVDISFVTSNGEWGDHAVKKDRTVERKLASPLYDGHIIYNEDLVAIKQKKKELLLNKPIYAGMCILDLSKLHMYRFHYDVIKKQYADRAKLLFTDTDSLCYHIRTNDFYADMHTERELYDLSNFDKTSAYYDETNKKVLGKFKDECDGKPPCEFIGLRPKMYSLKVGSKEKKTGKGIKKAFLKKEVTHADYKRCLLSNNRADQQQLASFNTIRSKRHEISTFEINKVGLCAYDNKRYLLDDGITSYSYGHHRTASIPSKMPE